MRYGLFKRQLIDSHRLAYLSLFKFIVVLAAFPLIPLTPLRAQTEEDTAEPIVQYKTETNIAYREGQGAENRMQELCRLDIYYPEKIKDYATVIWLHGGGLTGGRRYIPAELKNKNLAVVAVDYRLSPLVKSPVYIEDAAAAVAWVFKSIEHYGGSRQRIFLCGASAGGYLVCMVALDKKYLAVHGIDGDALAGLAPLTAQMITHFTIRKERGIGIRQPVVDEMAPLHHVRKTTMPILLVTGDRELELEGRYEENAYFWRMMKLSGNDAIELHEINGCNHVTCAEPALKLLVSFVKANIPVLTKPPFPQDLQ
jgi:acetyl esterase/lipase